LKRDWLAILVIGIEIAILFSIGVLVYAFVKAN